MERIQHVQEDTENCGSVFSCAFAGTFFVWEAGAYGSVPAVGRVSDAGQLLCGSIVSVINFVSSDKVHS